MQCASLNGTYVLERFGTPGGVCGWTLVQNLFCTVIGLHLGASLQADGKTKLTLHIDPVGFYEKGGLDGCLGSVALEKTSIMGNCNWPNTVQVEPIPLSLDDLTPSAVDCIPGLCLACNVGTPYFPAAMPNFGN
jgi:hypothetical protein